MKIIWKDECEIAHKATGFQWAVVSEFWVTIIAAIACYLLRETSAYFVTPVYFNLLNFEDSQKTRAAKADKLADKTFSMIYHVIIIIYGYIVLSETEYLPAMLGGSGSNKFTKFYSEFPCITSSYEESLRTYYLVTLGYRVFKTCLLMYQWCRNEHRSDFIEMFLHHTMTLTLYAFSFYMSFVKIGSVIMYLHDLVEPLLNSSKIFAEVKADKLVTMSSGILLWLIWGWTRIYVFP